jgi:hypothetical protein
MTSPISRQTTRQAQTAARGAAAANTARGHVTNALDLRRAQQGTPVTDPGNGLFARLGRGASTFMHAHATALDRARTAGGAAGVALGAVGVVRNGSAAVRSLGDAFTAARSGDRAGAMRALASARDSSFEAGRSGVSAARGALTIHNVQVARRGATAAVESFRRAGGLAGLSTTAARTLEASVAGAGSRIATAAASHTPAVARTAELGIQAGRRAMTAGALHAGTETAVRVAEHAGEAALRAGTRAGASTLGRAAARFAPGVNVAMAVVDTAIAGRDTYRAVQEPTPRNIGRAVFSGLTAAGSIVSATNIPVVSQIGAGVSTVTGFVAALF